MLQRQILSLLCVIIYATSKVVSIVDKISRLLLLYYKLSQGEKVNKISFCLETGCHPRSFDRDIEDIRLFLADTYIYDNLEYKRIEKIYQFTGNNRQFN